MLYLQSEDVADEVARLAAPDGPLEILSKAQSDEARTAEKWGSFARVDGRVVCLFRFDGALWLRIDDVLIAVTDGGATWDLFRDADGRVRGRFRVERGGETLVDFDYRPFGNLKPIPGDLTPFIDQEDYDYLILVSRVVQRPERRERFFREPWTR